MSADQLSVDQTSGRAEFKGNVVVVQGEIRMSADSVLVEYATDANAAPAGISQLVASGQVTFVTPSEAAEAAKATYSVDGGTVLLSGDVLLTQGLNALSSDQLLINLTTGVGQMEGRVRTIFGTGNN